MEQPLGRLVEMLVVKKGARREQTEKQIEELVRKRYVNSDEAFQKDLVAFVLDDIVTSMITGVVISSHLVITEVLQKLNESLLSAVAKPDPEVGQPAPSGVYI